MWKDLADLRAALPVAFEPERRTHQVAGLALSAQVAASQWLPMMFIEHGLGVERIDLRHAAIHEQEDNALGPRGEVRRLRRQGRGRFSGDRIRQADEAESAA